MREMNLSNGKENYSYSDASGKFHFVRERKIQGNKIVTRSFLTTPGEAKQRVLEKVVSLSKVGVIKSKKGSNVVLRPEAVEYNVWLEGKNYSSQLSLNKKKKAFILNLKSPESKWNGVLTIPFPKGKYFCFFSQIPECLNRLSFLSKLLENNNRTLSFYIVWDSFPYIQDQLTGVGKNLFSPAILKYDGKLKSALRYSVEVDGQIVLYHFSKSFELIKIAWISQGISIIPLGEENSENDFE